MGFADGSEDLPALDPEFDVTREPVLRKAAERRQQDCLIDFYERCWIHDTNSSRGWESLLSPTCRMRRKGHASPPSDRCAGARLQLLVESLRKSKSGERKRGAATRAALLIFRRVCPLCARYPSSIATVDIVDGASPFVFRNSL